MIVGVLALQGAFAKHIDMLKKLGAQTAEVRKPSDLARCDALVIPGGESTTMVKQMQFIEFLEPFRDFAKTKPIFGTCAGLILMAQEIVGDAMKPFDLLDVTVERNAFGRQAESFQAEIELNLKQGQRTRFPAIFIRAPRICKAGDRVKVLARFQEEPVLIQQGRHLGATFHPELTDNQCIHAYFLRQAAQ